MKSIHSLTRIVLEIVRIDNRSVPNSDGRFTPFVGVAGVFLFILLPYTIKALSVGLQIELNKAVALALVVHLTLWLLSAIWQEKLRGITWFCLTVRKLSFKERIGLIRIIRASDPLFFRLIN